MNMIQKYRASLIAFGSARLCDVESRLAEQAALRSNNAVAEHGPILLHRHPMGFFAEMDAFLTAPDPEPNIERGAE